MVARAGYLCMGANVDTSYSMTPVFNGGGSLPLTFIWYRLMTESNVVVRGLALPVVMGWQVGLYCDRDLGCPAAYSPVQLWRDSYGKGRWRVWTLGADLGRVQLRVVLERVRADSGRYWGLI